MIGLKPGYGSEATMARLRPQLQRLPGIATYLFAIQDLRAGGRDGQAPTNQFTLWGSDAQAVADRSGDRPRRA